MLGLQYSAPYPVCSRPGGNWLIFCLNAQEAKEPPWFPWFKWWWLELELKPPRLPRGPGAGQAGRPTSWGMGTSSLPGLQPPSAHREPWTQSPHTPQRQGGPQSWHSAKFLPLTLPEPAKHITSDTVTSISSHHEIKGLPFQHE